MHHCLGVASHCQVISQVIHFASPPTIYLGEDRGYADSLHLGYLFRLMFHLKEANSYRPLTHFKAFVGTDGRFYSLNFFFVADVPGLFA